MKIDKFLSACLMASSLTVACANAEKKAHRYPIGTQENYQQFCPTEETIDTGCLCELTCSCFMETMLDWPPACVNPPYYCCK